MARPSRRSFHQPMRWQLLQPHPCLHKTFSLEFHRCGVRKSFAGDSWTRCRRRMRDKLGGTHRRSPKFKYPSTELRCEQRAQQAAELEVSIYISWKRAKMIENQLNSSLSPWPVPQHQSFLPLNLCLGMEKHLGSFALLLIPPQNLHICLEKSSKYNFQGTLSISKFLSLQRSEVTYLEHSQPCFN